MRSRPRRSFFLTGALLLAPVTASAQFTERLSFGLEGGAGTQLLAPQSSEYGFGFTGGARLAVRLAGPVALQAFGSYWNWGSNDAQLPGGVLTGFGGGLRIAPWVGSAGRFVLDLDVGFSISGSNDANAGTIQASGLLLGGGVGWLFPLASVFSLGPMVRAHYLTSLESVSAGDRDRTLFWTIGVSFTFHGARVQPRVEPEETADPTRPRMRALEDTDHDGVPDAADRCVAQPETMNGYQDDDGCPDVVNDPNDADHDMILGAADRCPNEPEDADGFEDTDGCPEPDNDHDGVLDAADQCPDQAETRNGFQDDDGCSDTNPNPGALVDGDHILLTQPLGIRRGRVEASSAALISAVAQQLEAHPEIRRVRVECRSDEGGNERNNARLSTQCARNVVKALRRAGVNKRRLQAQGAGSLNATPGTPSVRVDFVVIDPAGGAAQGPAPVAVTPAEASEPADGHHGGRRGHHGRRRRH
ncbi:MAG: OmpA family protein [Polyangiales bacterium]